MKYRLLLVSNSGGVFLDLLALEPWWSQHQPFWAVVRAEDTESLLREYPKYWVDDPTSRPFGIAFSFFAAVWILRKVKPHLVVSSGSGAAVSFFAAAKLYRIPTFWLETFNFIEGSSLSGRICSHLASEILVQRHSMLKVRPKAQVIGELL